MHKWIVAGVLVAGTCLLVKKTSFLSYAGTLWSQVATQAKNQIPTRFEIERARHEIAQLDKDITAAPDGTVTVAPGTAEALAQVVDQFSVALGRTPLLAAAG